MVHAMAAWTIFILYARKVYTKNETGDSGLVQVRRGLFPVLFTARPYDSRSSRLFFRTLTPSHGALTAIRDCRWAASSNKRQNPYPQAGWETGTLAQARKHSRWYTCFLSPPFLEFAVDYSLFRSRFQEPNCPKICSRYLNERAYFCVLSQILRVRRILFIPVIFFLI